MNYGKIIYCDTANRIGCRTILFVSGYTHHGRAELDAAGFIRAEENDKQTNIKKFVENFTFFVKIRHIIYAIQNRLSCEPAFVYVLHIQCEYMDKLHLLILWKA